MLQKIIIVGAGVAGLAAGVYACRNGFETEIFELHNIPGGQCTGWARKGYHFDNSIHWLLGTKSGTGLNAVWRTVGALDDSVEIISKEALCSVDIDDTTVHLYTDPDRLREHFLAISPDDGPAINEFCSSVKALQRVLMPTDKPYDMMGPLDYARVMGPMVPALKHLTRLGKLTVGQLADGLRSPVLRQALGAALIPPYFQAVALVSTLASLSSGDAGWPLGGSLALSQRMEKTFLDLGGKVNYRARVAEIICDGSRATGIRLADGAVHSADYVISAADGHHTLFDLLGGRYLDADSKTLYEDGDAYPTYTSVHVSLGIAADLSHYPHVLFVPNNVDSGGDHIDPLVGLKHYCYDRTIAPVGKSVVRIMLRADYDWWKALSTDREAYDREKARIGLQVAAIVEARYLEAKGKVEVIDVATPTTYERYCNAWRGAWMAFATTPRGRIRSVSGVLPGLSGFVQAGQWLMPPGGLPVAVVTGKWAVQRICKSEKMRFRS